MKKSIATLPLLTLLLAIVVANACAPDASSPTPTTTSTPIQTQVRPTPPDGLKCFNAMFKNGEVDTVCQAPRLGYVDKNTYKPISIDFDTGKITPR